MSEAPLDLVIVGAGFSGLAMAIRARQAGFDRLLVLEKAAGVGGTWRENTYPGAACDVPSQLYSLSFAPKSDWSRLFAPQPEIEAYLEGLVAAHGLAPFLRLETCVKRAVFDAAAGLWRVETDRGVVSARVLVGAMGALHHPALPRLPGLERFSGKAFHSAAWDHSCDLTAQRVGVIGTGASAVQFVPEIVGRVAHLTQFQRSAPWILPRGDRPTGRGFRRLMRIAPLRRLHRASLFWRREVAALAGFTRVSRVTALAEAWSRRHLAASIADPALRRQLTPDYRLGCKRVLLSDDYYPALARPNASLVTAPIREVLPHGIVTADGAEHPLDVLIFATGFAPGGSVVRTEVIGRNGLSLLQAWKQGADAFRGVSVAGFPNFFLLLGPNTGLGHNSVLLMIEAQVAHVLGALKRLRDRPGGVLEVRPEAQARFREEVDARMQDSIWTQGGCGSWYLDRAGRNRTLWPGTVGDYVRGTERMRAEDYRLTDPPGLCPGPTKGLALSKP
ncbi:putative flavin-binding monooxygenase [Methylorubrum extorquens DM4]|uniref:Flavin-binding monooxygenase n=1 Tax=Methylorubrum extorquens (strain DSM 6343 / CIP 106787 / DM4) TaxID=661410 RepID=C7CKL9_METED|nr:NAD(P)/FAD-dependent oxidoreductase [Methylorubrum extorquens]CAX26789.1 putative flavin-binding monooxygenase [Methylorubrum extorquens DM4]